MLIHKKWNLYNFNYCSQVCLIRCSQKMNTMLSFSFLGAMSDSWCIFAQYFPCLGNMESNLFCCSWDVRSLGQENVPNFVYVWFRPKIITNVDVGRRTIPKEKKGSQSNPKEIPKIACSLGKPNWINLWIRHFCDHLFVCVIECQLPWKCQDSRCHLAVKVASILIKKSVIILLMYIELLPNDTFYK